MDAFLGVWKVDPSKNASISELFDHVAPPGYTKEELMQPHSVEFSLDGDLLTMKTNIPGKDQHVLTYTLGKTITMEGPGGAKIEMSGRFEDGKIYSTNKTPKNEVTMVRHIQDGNLVSEITVDGKTYVVTLSR